jgi:hypothetical protein
MSAPKENKNALGNTGGKSLQDRQLAASVRSLALGEIKKYLEAKEDGYKDKEMKSALLLKLAPSLLPRLNEVSGQDGEPIVISWLSPSRTSHGAGPKSSTPQVHAG